MKNTPPLSESIQRLENWLRQNRRHFLKGLAPGANAKDLEQCERRIGMKLPADLRTWLKWRNGQDEACAGYFEESWLMMGTEWIADVKSELDERADWKSAWIPIFDNDQGDYLFLDADQSPPPVRAYWLGKKRHPIVAASLAGWMTDFVQRVENGEYVEDDERGRFMRTP